MIDLAFVGFRIYRETGKTYMKDERGTYDGWSDRWDEWIPLYSPRIMPFETKSEKKLVEEVEIEEDLDELIQPEPGYARAYAVPRNFKCTSRHFMHYINYFGNEQGFEKILDVLENAEMDDSINMQVLVNMAILITLPAIVYHKSFMDEFGARIIKAIKDRLLGASDKYIRAIRREQVEVLFTTIRSMQQRIMDKTTSQREMDIFKLEMSLKYLNSELLEPRIQGIRELNAIIDANRSWSSSKTLSVDTLI